MVSGSNPAPWNRETEGYRYAQNTWAWMLWLVYLRPLVHDSTLPAALMLNVVVAVLTGTMIFNCTFCLLPPLISANLGCCKSNIHRHTQPWSHKTISGTDKGSGDLGSALQFLEISSNWRWSIESYFSTSTWKLITPGVKRDLTAVSKLNSPQPVPILPCVTNELDADQWNCVITHVKYVTKD